MEYGATAPAGPLAAPTRRRRGIAGLAVATLGAGALPKDGKVCGFLS